MALLCRVEIGSDRLDITLSRGRLAVLLASSTDLKMPDTRFHRPSKFFGSRMATTI